MTEPYSRSVIMVMPPRTRFLLQNKIYLKKKRMFFGSGSDQMEWTSSASVSGVPSEPSS